METLLIVLYVLLGICVLGLVYCVYQLGRNDEVYFIRINWISTRDKRHDKYTYKYMMNPKPHNWFGLRWPKENHYK